MIYRKQEVFFLRFASLISHADEDSFAATPCIKHHSQAISSIDEQYFYCSGPLLEQQLVSTCLIRGKQDNRRKVEVHPNGNNQRSGWRAKNNYLTPYFQTK